MWSKETASCVITTVAFTLYWEQKVGDPRQHWSVLCCLTSIECFINGGRVQITALYYFFFFGERSTEFILFLLWRLQVARVCCKPGPAWPGLAVSSPQCFPCRIFHHVALLSPGQLERIPLLFSLCYTLLPCQWMTWWLVSLVPACPRRASCR